MSCRAIKNISPGNRCSLGCQRRRHRLDAAHMRFATHHRAGAAPPPRRPSDLPIPAAFGLLFHGVWGFVILLQFLMEGSSVNTH